MALAGKPIKAKKISGSLVAAFPGATPPVVWKYDLEKNHSFALTLQGDDGDWELGVNSPRGEFSQVAHFVSREDAEEAFIRLQRSMLKKNRNVWRVVGPLCLVLSIIITGLCAWYFFHDILPSKMAMTEMPTPAIEMQPPAPLPIKQGVPMPADQVLMPPP